jgi:hypothetical protein
MHFIVASINSCRRISRVAVRLVLFAVAPMI